MFWLLIGAVILFALIGAARAFERASVTSIKMLLVWVAALAGLSLALLLVLSGRGGAALGALVMFGPLIWQKIQAARSRGFAAGPRAGSGAPSSGGPMSRAEAYQILGLRQGASEVEIREAHHRLMRKAHPDVGGSEWIATRINQARDVLLG